MRTKVLFSIAVVVLIAGCASKQELYYYDGYANSYYEYKQTPSEESLANLIKVIETDIEHRDKGIAKRVPPGLYAELGYLYIQAGNSAKAIEFFQKEKTTYPESTIFMDRVIAKITTEKEEEQ